MSLRLLAVIVGRFLPVSSRSFSSEREKRGQWVYSVIVLEFL